MKKLSHNYKTSKDYKKLLELMKTQRIVCFINTALSSNRNRKTENTKPVDTKEYVCQDICQTSVIHNEEFIEISCRGVVYVSAMEINGIKLEEDFIRQCTAIELEFIEP